MHIIISTLTNYILSFHYASDDNPEAVIITNVGGGPNITGGSRPDTPLSQRNTEFYSNKMVVEGGSSQESEGSSMTGLQTTMSPVSNYIHVYSN